MTGDDAGSAPAQPIGYLIRRAQQLHVATWTRVVSSETSSVQYSVMAALDQRGGASQRELCEDVDLDRSTIADLVARMQRRGLVERRRDVSDARRNTVTLTAHGRAELRRLEPLVERVQEELVASMTPKAREALRHGLSALLARDSSEEDPSHGPGG